MATPDISEYVDLAFFDKDPQDVFDAALLDLQVKMPDWTPREGNVEVMLLEAIALQVAEAIFAVNRLPGAVLQALMKLYGVYPNYGELPVVDVKFTAMNADGYVVPAGTRVRLNLTSGREPIIFATDVELTIAAGSTFGTTAATGDRYTEEGNGVPADTQVIIVDSITFLDRADTASVVSDGADPETDDEWLERSVQRLARLSETLVQPKHFTAAVLENADVAKAQTLDNWNGAAGAPGDHAGHLTVAVYGEGATLSADRKTELEAALEEQAAANLDVHVIDPTITAVPVTVTVQRLAGYSDAEVQAAITTALSEYLDPNEWDWATTVRRNELIALISNVDGVDYVTTLTAPAADVVLTGHAALADLGALTITTTP